MEKFKNKVVLITGAAGDLGRQLVADFLAEGAEVLAVDTSEEKLSALEEQGASNALVTNIVDVTSSAEMQALAVLVEEETLIPELVDIIVERFGGRRKNVETSDIVSNNDSSIKPVIDIEEIGGGSVIHKF